MDADSLVTIAVFGTVQEAEIARGMLVANDIDVLLVDEEMSRVYLFPLIGGVKLQVRAEDAEIAQSLLNVPAEPPSGDVPY